MVRERADVSLSFLACLVVSPSCEASCVSVWRPLEDRFFRFWYWSLAIADFGFASGVLLMATSLPHGGFQHAIFTLGRVSACVQYDSASLPSFSLDSLLKIIL